MPRWDGEENLTAIYKPQSLVVCYRELIRSYYFILIFFSPLYIYIYISPSAEWFADEAHQGWGGLFFGLFSVWRDSAAPGKPLIIQRRKCGCIYSRQGNARRVPTGGQIWKPGVNYS